MGYTILSPSKQEQFLMEPVSTLLKYLSDVFLCGPVKRVRDVKISGKHYLNDCTVLPGTPTLSHFNEIIANGLEITFDLDKRLLSSTVITYRNFMRQIK